MILSLCSVLASFAQGNGMAGISEATNMVTSYFDPLTKLIFAVAAILKYFGPAMLKEFEKRIALYGTLGIVALVGLVVALKMLT